MVNGQWSTSRVNGQYGDETAHWDGDTLVIDSISIDERTWICDGRFHSDQLHVIERLRRPSMNYLECQFTIEDPKVPRGSNREFLHAERERGSAEEAGGHRESQEVREPPEAE